MPINDHKGEYLHSLYGRKLGLDNNGFLIGPPSGRNQTETITTTAPSTLMVGGTSILQATGSAVYELPVPTAALIGVQKRIISNTTGAVSQLVKLTAGNFMSFTGSSQLTNTITLSTRGAFVDLEYLSTALVFAGVNSTSTAGTLVSFTTTT